MTDTFTYPQQPIHIMGYDFDRLDLLTAPLLYLALAARNGDVIAAAVLDGFACKVVDGADKQLWPKERDQFGGPAEAMLGALRSAEATRSKWGGTKWEKETLPNPVEVQKTLPQPASLKTLEPITLGDGDSKFWFTLSQDGNLTLNLKKILADAAAFAGPQAANVMRAMVPEWDVMPPLEVPRSGKWPRLRAVHMHLHPECVVCKTRADCVPHHVEPVHLFPELELDPDNLVTLCPPHHLLVGHLMNWRAYNPVIRDWVTMMSEAIRDRPTAVAKNRTYGPVPSNQLITRDMIESGYRNRAILSEQKCDALLAAYSDVKE